MLLHLPHCSVEKGTKGKEGKGWDEKEQGRVAQNVQISYQHKLAGVGPIHG